MITLLGNGQVRMQRDIDFPVPAGEVWRTVSDVESFACIDFFHRKIRFVAGGSGRSCIHIEHGLFPGVSLWRSGRVYGWREGHGYGFSDLSRREPRRGFPHVYLFSLHPLEGDRCRLRIDIRGRWTAAWIPGPIVRLWLRLVFWKIGVSAEAAVLKKALRRAR